MKDITGLVIFGILLGIGSCIQGNNKGEPLESFSYSSSDSIIFVCKESSFTEQKPQMVKAVLIISK